MPVAAVVAVADDNDVDGAELYDLSPGERRADVMAEEMTMDRVEMLVVDL